MASTSVVIQPATRQRLQSVDALRGAIMMLMAIDHIRDFIARSAMQFSPTDLTRTTAPIFLTRWITHFCAPVFILTAGISAFLWMQRGEHSRSELSRFLATRGIWLIVLELTVLRLIMFSQISFRGNLIILLILCAIGASMIVLAGLIHLPLRALAVVGVMIICFHNLLDRFPAERFGRFAWLWEILHQQGLFSFAGMNFLVAYPVLPWIGVIALGYCLGRVFLWEAGRRQRFFLQMGVALTIAFFVLRWINIYGDPLPWKHQPTAIFTALSFLNTTKYPPSLIFLLMTLGPAFVALSYLDRIQFASTNPLIVFGRVPFFYYIGHLVVAHLIEIVLNLVRYGAKPFLWLAPPSMGSPATVFPADFGFPLWTVYAVWLVVLALLYPACLWFMRVKQRRRDWWLSYL